MLYALYNITNTIAACLYDDDDTMTAATVAVSQQKTKEENEKEEETTDTQHGIPRELCRGIGRMSVFFVRVWHTKCIER